MYEVEHKYRLTPEQASHLDGWLPFGDTERQEDRVYLQRTTSFDDFKRGDPVVRLRQVDGVCSLTLKQAESDSTSREIETSVSEFESADDLLIALGLNPVTSITKARKTYAVDGLSVCLDRVEGLGSFLELEVFVEREDLVQAAESRLTAYRDELGLDVGQLEPRKYDVLISELAKSS